MLVRPVLLRRLFFSTLFLTGWNLALPVADPGTLPVWATPITVVHGVFLDNALLLVYFAVLLSGGRPARRLNHLGRLTFALILMFALVGYVSSIVNVQPYKIGEALRFILFAAYFAEALRWAEARGPSTVLGAFLLGILAAGVLNLYFALSLGITGPSGMPALLGQNGPGGTLGFAVVLSAMLMLIARRPAESGVALGTFAVSITAAAMSYSKLSLLMALLGVAAFALVIWRLARSRRTRRAVALLILSAVVLAIRNADALTHGVREAKAIAEFKFSDGLVADEDVRKAYYSGSAEVLLKHPFFGVGYDGFNSAFAATSAANLLLGDDPSLSVTPNPHSALLYYAVANGVPGLVLVLLLTGTAFGIFLRAFGACGTIGFGLAVAICGASIIHIATLPSSFDTAILYIPAASACAMISRRSARFRRAERAAIQPSSLRGETQQCAE